MRAKVITGLGDYQIKKQQFFLNSLTQIAVNCFFICIFAIEL